MAATLPPPVAAPPRAPPRQPRVLIAGGGVGGLALAVGLRARGVTDVLVLERESSLESAAARSTGLGLWPNGSAALRQLAPALRLDEAVAHAGEPLLGGLFAPGGCAPGAPPLIRHSQEALATRHGAPAVTLRWRALTAALAAALPPDTLRCCAPLLRFETLPRGGGVRATFGGADAPQTLEADVLIGADGIRSAVRAQLLGDQPPRDAGRIAWRAIVPTTPELEALCPRGSSFMAASPQEGRTMTLMHVSKTEFYWALGCLDAGVAPSPPPTPAGNNGYAASDAAAAAAAATFATWPPAQAALAATPRGAVLTQRLWDRPPLAPEALAQAGPVSLLGDALHAMIPSLGQGACAALEGALELAQCMSGAAAQAQDASAGAALEDDAEAARQRRAEALHAALRRYEAARLARVTAIQLRSASAGAAAYGARSGGCATAQTAQMPMQAAAHGVPGQPALSPEQWQDWLHGYRSPHAELDALAQSAAAQPVV